MFDPLPVVPTIFLGGVTILETKADYDVAVNDSNTQLVIIDFFTTWCPPCKSFAPIYEQLAKDNQGVKFAKCDCDANSETAKAVGIECYPTIKGYKFGKEVQTIKGASKEAVEAMIKNNQ